MSVRIVSARARMLSAASKVTPFGSPALALTLSALAIVIFSPSGSV